MNHGVSFVLIALIAYLSLAAPPIIPTAGGSLTPTVIGPESLFGNTTNEIIHLTHHIPSSPLTLTLLLNPSHPIARAPLGHTILRAQSLLRTYLSTHPDSYLTPEEWDPFETDYLRTGKCFIGLKSLKPGGPGQERLTFRGVLEVLGGLWECVFGG
ncbi:MAG: hypothetical protein L6R41_002983 [Letrouitia leprolyta]|nr:MAG: hypothetical protein L6R41_002983 [Letrouitia leprolyta]